MKWFRNTMFYEGNKDRDKRLISDDIVKRVHLLKQLLINEFNQQTIYNEEEFKQILTDSIEFVEFENLEIQTLYGLESSYFINVEITFTDKKDDYHLTFNIEKTTKSEKEYYHVDISKFYILNKKVEREANKVMDLLTSEFKLCAKKILKSPYASSYLKQYGRKDDLNFIIEPLDYNKDFNDFVEFHFERYFYKKTTDTYVQKVNELYQLLLTLKLFTKQLYKFKYIENKHDLEKFLNRDAFENKFSYYHDEEEVIDDYLYELEYEVSKKKVKKGNNYDYSYTDYNDNYSDSFDTVFDDYAKDKEFYYELNKNHKPIIYRWRVWYPLIKN